MRYTRVTFLVIAALALVPGVSRTEEISLASRFALPVSSQFSTTAVAQSDVAGATDTLRSPESFHSKHRFLRTAAEVEFVNVFLTLVNRYIIREGEEIDEFRVGWDSIKENLKNGWEWDDNNFHVNHFMHPYHGGLYHNAARANGYSFYEAIPFNFAGSYLWEYAGETNHASINDWIMTALGGVSMGESLFRFSSMVLDNTARGSERTWREIGGFLIAPTRGFNRLITGEAFNVHANPPDRHPGNLGAMLRIGARTIGTDNLWNGSSSKMFIAFDAEYGDVFEEPMEKPFDQFDFGIQFNLRTEGKVVGRIEARGQLVTNTVAESEVANHKLGAYTQFDYFDNEAYTFGGQGVSASYLSRIRASETFEIRTQFHLNGIILGASKSDYFSVSGREYDYGPGIGVKFESRFLIPRGEVFRIGHDENIIHSINGNVANHYVNFTYVRAGIPIRSFFNAGVEYYLYMSERRYADFDDVSTRNPELRVYVSWNVD